MNDIEITCIGVARFALGAAIAPKNPRLTEHQKPKTGRPYSIRTFRAFAQRKTFIYRVRVHQNSPF